MIVDNGGAELTKGVRLIVIASSNEGKVKELTKFLNGVPVRVTMLPNAGYILDGVEGESDYEANAVAKARRAAEASGDVSLGEDSGLEVDFMGGAPGPLSARFVSASASPGEKNEALLQKLSGVPKDRRTARFVSVVAIAETNGEVDVFRGECEGRIAFEAAGESGFGYDPIFIPLGYDRTFGELGLEIKNKVSHRARAMAQAREYFVSNV